MRGLPRLGTKRALPDGATHLRFTGLELLRRLAALVPPPRRNRVRFHGVFAPGARLRPSSPGSRPAPHPARVRRVSIRQRPERPWPFARRARAPPPSGRFTRRERPPGDGGGRRESRRPPREGVLAGLS
ncbi:hypothetical protein D7V97_40860 [Corallococcus sp. CA053C]|uniref:transposase n=1 Tax=Corallococcus sp. CA053C TaxID=2316732 RepID=UPI000EA40052|nr:hypothetical protein D7V97_40860 [Corallococcus sp. CA053C]